MRVVTFGEIMLRLKPEGYLRFLQADKYEATYGGGEANVAVSLANFGVDAAFITKLPENDIGEGAVRALRAAGVDVSGIVRGGERTGIYFLEAGASARPSKVIYDRAGSAIAKAGKNDFNWKKIFKGADWFHFTGITPALGDNVAEITLKAVKAARAAGLKVSCDLNYRKKLWSREKARSVMEPLMEYVDVVIANEEDASDVFGITAPADVTGGKVEAAGYVGVARELIKRFDLEYAAITLRGSISASDNRWSAVLVSGDGSVYSAKEYLIHIVDRVGGGDSFGAGLIYGLSNFDPRSAVEFATAASCLKQTIEGDFNMVTVDEVKRLSAGDASGRISR